MRPLCAQFVRTMSMSRCLVKPMGPQCAHGAPTMRPLSAHYVGIRFRIPWQNESDVPALCSHAPSMRPLCVETGPGGKR